MNWETICTDPNLKDLPYKVELNARGQIIMSPAKLYHGRFQSEIVHILKTLLTDGEVVTECAIKTSDSTKVADVAWFSQERWERVKDEFDASIAPEVCIEIMSHSNTQEELENKKRLYLEAGAMEFWVCSEEGKMRFYDKQRELTLSDLVAQFPQNVDQ